MFYNPFNQKHEQHKETAQQAQDAILSKQAQEIFKDKPFSQEYKRVYQGAKVVKFSTNIVSFFTGFFAALFVLKLLVGYYVAFIVSFALCAVLELIKNSLWLSTIKNKLRYNKIGLGLLFLVTMSLLSLGASCFGAYVMLDNFNQDKVLSYTKQDSIYLNELAAINKQISQAQTTQANITSGTNLTSSTNKRTSANLTNQVSILQANKDSLTAKIEAINKRISSEQEQVQEVTKKEQEDIRFYLVLMSALSELLYLIASIFVFYYLFRVYVDSPQTNSFKQFTTVVNEPQEAPQEDIPQQRNIIGFKAYTDKNTGIKYIVHNQKKYTEPSIKQNIAANKSKLNQALEDNDKSKIERYKKNLEKWQNYYKQVQE